MEQKSAVNKLVFHPRFKDVVSEISKLDIKLPPPVEPTTTGAVIT